MQSRTRTEDQPYENQKKACSGLRAIIELLLAGMLRRLTRSNWFLDRLGCAGIADDDTSDWPGTLLLCGRLAEEGTGACREVAAGLCDCTSELVFWDAGFSDCGFLILADRTDPDAFLLNLLYTRSWPQLDCLPTSCRDYLWDGKNIIEWSAT
jgi:hypothetical protein